MPLHGIETQISALKRAAKYLADVDNTRNRARIISANQKSPKVFPPVPVDVGLEIGRRERRRYPAAMELSTASGGDKEFAGIPDLGRP